MPKWTPDGQLCVSYQRPIGSAAATYLMMPDGSGKRKILDPAPSAIYFYDDSYRFVYCSPDETICTKPISITRSRWLCSKLRWQLSNISRCGISMEPPVTFWSTLMRFRESAQAHLQPIALTMESSLSFWVRTVTWVLHSSAIRLIARRSFLSNTMQVTPTSRCWPLASSTDSSCFLKQTRRSTLARRPCNSLPMGTMWPSPKVFGKVEPWWTSQTNSTLWKSLHELSSTSMQEPVESGIRYPALKACIRPFDQGGGGTGLWLSI